MNSRFLTCLISLSMLVGVSSISAVVHKIDRWVKKSADGNTQAVTCFSVLAYDKGDQERTERERQDIVNAARVKNALVVVTDDTMVDDGRGVLQKAHDICVKFQRHCFKGYKEVSGNSIIDTSSLSGLTDACRTNDVQWCNVEFRQFLCDQHKKQLTLNGCEETPSMAARKLAKPKIQRDAPIAMSDVATTLKKIREEVFRSGATIKDDSRDKFIKAAIEDVISSRQQCTHEDFVEYIKAALRKLVSQEEQEQKVTAAGKEANGLNLAQQRIDTDKVIARYKELFNCWVSARVIHRVATTDRKNVFVCANDVDIKNVSRGLESLGYTREQSAGQDVRCITEQDIRHVIENESIDIASYFNRKPAQPVFMLQQPKRSQYWHLLCATAAVATLSYFGYWWYQRVFAR